MTSSKQSGKYIVIEGHDGTGKSTQVGLLRERLSREGIESIEFHEPEGTPIATELRRIIKDGTLPRDPLTNLLLFTAARHEIWNYFAKPALAEGKWVVAARNYYSTLAYQGYGEGLDLDLIKNTTAQFTDDHYMNPDCAIILSLNDTKERERRITERGTLKKPDAFESRGQEFITKVTDGYLQISKAYAIPAIDARKSRDEVAPDVWIHIQKLL